MKSAEYWIEKLQLQSHPEGGYFRKSYRATESIQAVHLPNRFNGDRSFSTAIYYLLKGEQFSAFHRLKSDELWHFYSGSSLTIYLLNQEGVLVELQLGDDFDAGESFQLVVPANTWLAARCGRKDSYSLVGSTVAPGFDFIDLDFANRQDLIKEYPENTAIISQLTQPKPRK